MGWGFERRVRHVQVWALLALLLVAACSADSADTSELSAPARPSDASLARLGPPVTGVDDLVGLCRSTIDLDSIPSDAELRAGGAPSWFPEEDDRLRADTAHTRIHWMEGSDVIELAVPRAHGGDDTARHERIGEVWVEHGTATSFTVERDLGPGCTGFSVQIRPLERPEAVVHDSPPDVVDRGLEIVDGLHLGASRPETCGVREAGLATLASPDHHSAAVAFVEGLLGSPAEPESRGFRLGTLDAGGCEVRVAIDTADETDAVVVELTGEPHDYSVRSASLGSWVDEPSGGTPQLEVRVDDEEVAVELDHWCESCVEAIATLSPMDGAGSAVEARTTSPPARFAFPPPDEPVPLAVTVRIIDDRGALAGLRGRVVDPGAPPSGPDCGDFDGRPFSSGVTPDDAALRFATGTAITWIDASVTSGDDRTPDPCRPMLTGPGGLLVETVVRGHDGNFGVVEASGSLDSTPDRREIDVSLVAAGISVDDPFWCDDCTYRLITVQFGDALSTGLETSEPGPQVIELLGETVPDGVPAMVTVSTSRVSDDAFVLAEVRAFVVPAEEIG